MHKTLLAIMLMSSLAACTTTHTQRSQAVTMTPTVIRQAPVQMAAPRQMQSASMGSSSAAPELKPGPNYVASFPEADRRAACVRLKYVENTPKFTRCLQGDFPENPYFRQ